MDWIRSNWRIVSAAVVALIWAAQMFGPSVLHFARNTYAKLRPKVEQKTTVLSSWPLLAIAILLGPSLIPAPSPVAPVTPERQPDLYDTCAAAGRILLCDELEKIASQTFADAQAKEDAINDKILDVLDASFEPFNQKLADAAKADQLKAFAGTVRKGELRE